MQILKSYELYLVIYVAFWLIWLYILLLIDFLSMNKSVLKVTQGETHISWCRSLCL